MLDALRADKRLVHPDGRRQGEVVFAWSYGVVLPNITRKQFTEAQLGQAIATHRVICSDEMTDSVEPETFRAACGRCSPRALPHAHPAADRPRALDSLPQVRIPEQASLFDEADMQAEVPDMLRVMDLQQEQLARSLGDGHRVIHGVAGSGKPWCWATVPNTWPAPTPQASPCWCFATTSRWPSSSPPPWPPRA